MNAQARVREGTMNSRPSLEQIPGLVRALGTLGLLVVTAGIAPALWAQNAAQRTALAKLGAPRANVLSNSSFPLLPALARSPLTRRLLLRGISSHLDQRFGRRRLACPSFLLRALQGNAKSAFNG